MSTGCGIGSASLSIQFPGYPSERFTDYKCVSF
jgi:hypothetical protein